MLLVYYSYKQQADFSLVVKLIQTKCNPLVVSACLLNDFGYKSVKEENIKIEQGYNGEWYSEIQMDGSQCIVLQITDSINVTGHSEHIYRLFGMCRMERVHSKYMNSKSYEMIYHIRGFFTGKLRTSDHIHVSMSNKHI